MTKHGHRAQISGGVVIAVPELDNAATWLEWFGVTVTGKKKRVAQLYKAVNDQFLSRYEMSYAPGSQPVAPDWDGGKNRCGGGLHLSPSPKHALNYASSATKFVVCHVLIEDIAPIYDATGTSDKVKVRAVQKVQECDIDGVVKAES